jgi:fermentation-respiration switch protein FrsA (DUF1100 family)
VPAFFDQYLVYHPAPWEDQNWARASGLPLQDVIFETEDRIRLFGWFVTAGAEAGVLLWCHGNAGNIINRLDNLAWLHRFGISVFLFDYRGYGRSQGRPSEPGLYRDALAAYDYVTKARGVPASKLVLFGRSLGASVAGHVASLRPVAGLILESAFPSVEAVARHYYFGLPVHWLLGARFPLDEKLKSIHVPILVIHGAVDDIIPFEMGQRVFEVANEPKSFYTVPGADHNNLYVVGATPYFQRLKRFMDEVVRPG